VDELFVKEREQMLAVVERDLAELKQEEAALNIGVKELAENNHLLVETDAEYAAKTRETSGKRNAEIQRLTLNVHDLEAEVKRVRAMKTSFFGGFSKKAKAQREADILNKLASAETELERALQLFKAEQEKFHDEYEKKKQATTEKVQRLEKEVERLENDESIKVRHDASETLCEAISALLERQPAKPKEPA
jgi:chromosome segregation ATPase